jgi:ATP-dependent helicase/nuclease subunit A
VLTVVTPPGEAATSWTAMAVEAPDPEPAFAPLVADGVARVAATVESALPDTARPVAVSTTSLGTLVHRLLAHARHRDERDPRVLARVARQLADRVDTTDAGDDLVERAVTLCLGVLSRPELTVLPEGARLVFEAAYSRRRPDGRIERGAIDGLVVSDEAVTVLEFKTGQPREAHQVQLAAYVEAMRERYAGRRVEGRLIYADAPPA